jgi:uncharacterized membrane protein YdbT with pleckstrin-like domain
MSYVEKNLLPGERVTYRAHLHWAIYIPAVLIVALGILLLIVVGSASQAGGATHYGIGGVVILVGAVVYLFAWIKVQTSEFAVTDKRVVIKVGLIRRHSLELLLRQVETIGVEQGIVGRIFGYGAIMIGGTGGTKEPFKSISHPLEFRRQVQIQSTSSEPASAPAQAPSGSEKICPRCAESVKAAAKVCRFCNYEFT